jgi:hypothetical protein
MTLPLTDDRPLTHVWCDNCDKPAIREIEVTSDGGKTTYTAAKCADHVWVLLAPVGPDKTPHNPSLKGRSR